MGWFRRHVGLDAVDTAIHIIATGFLAGVADVVSATNDEGFVLFICGLSTVLFGIRRQAALKRRGPIPETTGEVAALRVDELEARVHELEAAQLRVAELEERLDFAERLLARQPDAARLAPGGE